MVFSSTLFLLFFFPLFILLYHAVSKQYRNLVLLAGSIFFYSWGAPKFVFVVIGSTVIDFYLVKKLHHSTDSIRRKQWLFLSIFLNLGLLLYFKYANFFVENLSALLQSMGLSEVKWVKVALPIGISFYTFQTLTYSIDVYRKVHRPLDKLTDYLLYIMSFPQMIAGPIVRFNSIADQITSRTENIDDKLLGLFRFAIGLSKKVLIANTLGLQADLIMDQNPDQLSFATAWLGIVAYTFQIYFDFSGYSDMAIGMGKIMGFRFPENFNNPYISQSISEFWRRWHITLGTWMKDYLYIPLGGNRTKSKSRLFFNLWFVFLVSGLWHGASWNFVLWGAYHGLFLILDRLFLIRLLSKIGRLPRVGITFFIVVIGWVLFRLENMDTVCQYLQILFSVGPFWLSENIPTSFYVVLCLAFIFSFVRLSHFGGKLEQTIYGASRYSIGGYVLGTLVSGFLIMLCISSITSSGFNPFIYFRF